MVTFSGAEKLIIIDQGVTLLKVNDVYSLWKSWMAIGNNLTYEPAFRVVGGETTTGSSKITPYFFLTNGWKIRPQEANHTLTVDGILVTDDNEAPFVDTIDNWRISIQSIVPLYAETTVIDSSDVPIKVEAVLSEADRVHLSELQNYNDTAVKDSLDSVLEKLNDGTKAECDLNKVIAKVETVNASIDALGGSLTAMVTDSISSLNSTVNSNSMAITTMSGNVITNGVNLNALSTSVHSKLSSIGTDINNIPHDVWDFVI